MTLLWLLWMANFILIVLSKKVSDFQIPETAKKVFFVNVSAFSHFLHT